MTPATTANGPIVPPPMPGAYCQMRFDRTPVRRAGDRPGQDAHEDRADRVEIDGQLQDGLDGVAQHDVDRDRDRHQDDDPGAELPGKPVHAIPPAGRSPPPSRRSACHVRPCRRQPSDTFDELVEERAASASTATSTFGGRPQTRRQSVTVSPVVSVPPSSTSTVRASVRTSVGSSAAASASGSWMKAP